MSKKKKMRLRRRLAVMNRAVRMEMREHRSTFMVHAVLRILVILMMILQIFNRNYENVFLCVLTLILFLVPSFIQVNLKIELPTGMEITILVFIFAAEILGEISAYYIIIPFWDTILHIINGFLMAAIGFALVDILNRSQKAKFNLSPTFLSIVAFCFSMTIGVLWEFFEWTIDHFLGYDMQKDTIIHTINSVALDPTRTNTVVSIKDIQSVVINGKDLGMGGYLDIGLNDTMEDLFVNFIGAIVFSVIGYFYVKNRGKGKRSFAERFIPRRKDDDRDFLKQAEMEEKREEAEKALLKEEKAREAKQSADDTQNEINM